MTLDEAAPVAPAPRRRAGGDPVKTLLHRHRALCERAVDPLEIAAGLEVQGITDRTAARFRHRDVFSLAEELYARTPRGDEPAAPRTVRPSDARALRGFGYALLPGALALGAAAAAVPYAGPVAVLATVAALVWPARPGRTGRAAAGRFPYAALLLAAAVVGWAVLRHGTPSESASHWPRPPATSSAPCTPPAPGAGSSAAAPWRTSPTGPGRC